MSELTPADRSLLGRQLAQLSWANTTDRSARTAPGRAALVARFEREVDPDNQLDPADRARRAEHKRKAYYSGLALRSARARRKASAFAAQAAGAEVLEQADVAETEFSEAGGPDAA